MEEVTNTPRLHNFNLDSFKKDMEAMSKIRTTETRSTVGIQQTIETTKDYTKEQIAQIISSGGLLDKILLSRNYFNKNGFYKRILIHYATLLMYAGIVIPKFPYGTKPKEDVKKRYYKVLNYIDNNNLQDLYIHWVIRALRDGCYYGIRSDNPDRIITIDLPPQFCSTAYKSENGLDLIRFDLKYFDSIAYKEEERLSALRAFPTFIERAYKRYKKGLISSIIDIPEEYGVCLPILDCRPIFLNVILSAIGYEEAVDLVKARELEEIRKIIVQKIPHLNDGQLLFEPDEAVEIHRGTVEMVKGNKNLNVLTTYADVDSIVSKTSADNQSSLLDSMVNNIYYESGTSGQLFGSNSNLALETSLKNDLAFTTIFSYKLSNIITNIINRKYGKSTISFRYSLLPVTYYNATDYLDSSFKLAQSGYSFILPVLGLGLSTYDLTNLKTIENDVMKLSNYLKPLESAYTQSSGDGNKNSENSPGAPEKKAEDKAPHTVENEKSLDKQGSSK